MSLCKLEVPLVTCHAVGVAHPLIPARRSACRPLYQVPNYVIPSYAPTYGGVVAAPAGAVLRKPLTTSPAPPGALHDWRSCATITQPARST